MKEMAPVRLASGRLRLETWTGTDQIRDYKFDGERLMLATAPSPNPFTGQMSVRTLTWEKVK
jgi:hypothetical protein